MGGEKAVVGVISDTHGRLRPEALAALRGSDLIIHAGDVGAPEILDELRGLAPVVAVRGNVDRGPWARRLPAREVVEVGRASIHVLHDVNDLDMDPRAAGFQAVIAGHSHRPSIEERAGVLFLNPGSAGPRRFTLPISLARLVVRGGILEPTLIDLPVGRGAGRLSNYPSGVVSPTTRRGDRGLPCRSSGPGRAPRGGRSSRR